MKNKISIIVISIITSLITSCITCSIKTSKISNTNNTRDYVYEHYCDSIYDVNPNYYLDVLMEQDEYIEYVNKHGEWWNE